MSILEWLGLAGNVQAPGATESEAVRRITTALATMEPDRARYLASFAYLLGRVANADHTVGGEEQREIARIVREEGQLTDEQAALVGDLAAAESFSRRGTDDFQVAREFAGLATEAQRLALLRCMFAVSASDHAVVTAEDNEVRSIAVQLKIPHDAFIAARTAIRDKLAVLKPGGGIRPALDGPLSSDH